MTDKELLELAAKACGFVYVGPDHEDYTQDWNPLINDGDAFILAVKLDMQVRFNLTPIYIEDSAYTEVFVHIWVDEMPVNITVKEDSNSDPFAAARKAVVRAAAEIGRNLNKRGN